jgi:hypothetical protein
MFRSAQALQLEMERVLMMSETASMRETVPARESDRDSTSCQSRARRCEQQVAQCRSCTECEVQKLR